MILDNIKFATMYEKANDRFAAGLEYLAKTDFSAAEPGRVDIRGDEVFALIQRYQTKPIDQGKFEAHQRYIDIQFIAEGAEQIGVGDTDAMEPIDPYDTEKDLVFLNGTGQMITVSAGMFCVLYPHEAHMPMIAVDSPAEVLKIVVKVLAE